MITLGAEEGGNFFGEGDEGLAQPIHWSCCVPLLGLASPGMQQEKLLL